MKLFVLISNSMFLVLESHGHLVHGDGRFFYRICVRKRTHDTTKRKKIANIRAAMKSVRTNQKWKVQRSIPQLDSVFPALSFFKMVRSI